jgi:putative polyketide hydroxylase
MSVVIVGGGLVGLSTALFLGHHGVPATVVERHGSTSIHPKARGLNARTMELFRGTGLAGPIREAGRILKDNHHLLAYDTMDKPPLRRIIDTSDQEATSRISPETECMCAQDLLEPVLLAEARRLGADIRFGVECTSFSQDADGVTVTTDSGTIRADYLVACDGARSPIRETLGIGLSGTDTVITSVGVTFRADLADLTPEPFIVAWTRTGIIAPINNTDRWMFHVPVNPPHTLADFTGERCVELIRTATGRPDLDVELEAVAPWETTSVVADRYRDGRVLLAGDAAHLMPPAGAFGANTGVHDAHNLAWKLAYVHTGQAGPALLDTYETERKPVAEMTTDQAMNRWQTWVNHNPMPIVDERTVVFGPQYDSTAINNPNPPRPLRLDLDGTPGTRVPHAWLADGRSTLDLVGTDFVLLYDDNRFADAPVKSHQVDLGLGAILVRPDGYVAWHGTEPTDLDKVLDQILTR